MVETIPYYVQINFEVLVYDDCVLENGDDYYDRVYYSPDLSSSDFYWEIPKTCLSENNDNPIFLIDSQSELDIPVNINTNHNR